MKLLLLLTYPNQNLISKKVVKKVVIRPIFIAIY